MPESDLQSYSQSQKCPIIGQSAIANSLGLASGRRTMPVAKIRGKAEAGWIIAPKSLVRSFDILPNGRQSKNSIQHRPVCSIVRPATLCNAQTALNFASFERCVTVGRSFTHSINDRPRRKFLLIGNDAARTPEGQQKQQTS